MSSRAWARRGAAEVCMRASCWKGARMGTDLEEHAAERGGEPFFTGRAPERRKQVEQYSGMIAFFSHRQYV